MTAYYNEIDKYAAQWLRNLIAAGHIAPGDVDERNIEDVRPDDLAGYTQCHFFAGVAVWSYALRRAGWPDDHPVWTGSCPCQPFSAAGKGGGVADERHLWPAFFHLIGERRPPVIYGEQVASKDGLGWLDLVSADMEAAGYAFGAVDTCSAGSGAPHIRQRLRFVAQRLDDAAGARHLGPLERSKSDPRDEARLRLPGAGRGTGRLGDDDDAGLEGQRGRHPAESGRVGAVRPATTAGEPRGLADDDDDDDDRREAGLRGRSVRAERDAEHGDGLVGLADARLPEPQRRDDPTSDDDRRRSARNVEGGELTPCSATSRPGPVNGFWADADWLFCRDGKWRPVEPGTFPLAHGAASRVGRLRAYGNAVDAEATRHFIEASIGALGLRLSAPSALTTDAADNTQPDLKGAFA